jgi:hypothetical protein
MYTLGGRVTPCLMFAKFWYCCWQGSYSYAVTDTGGSCGGGGGGRGISISISSTNGSSSSLLTVPQPLYPKATLS